MESYPAQLGEVYKITVIEQTEANAMWDRIPMVRIDGKLYYDTGRESIMDARCGTMDGEITSTVDGTEIPTEDNQSNFGSGFTRRIFSNCSSVIFKSFILILHSISKRTQSCASIFSLP